MRHPLGARSSSQHGYGFLGCCYFKNDHIDLIDRCGGCLARPGKAVHVDETRVVVSVVLPDGGVLDFVNRFMTDNPGCVE